LSIVWKRRGTSRDFQTSAYSFAGDLHLVGGMWLFKDTNITVIISFSSTARAISSAPIMRANPFAAADAQVRRPAGRRRVGLLQHAVEAVVRRRDTSVGVTPTHFAVIFDHSSKTFRNELYPEYKANRSAPPEDLVPQFAVIREATRAFDLPCIEWRASRPTI
jgi:hypothetical protein